MARIFDNIDNDLLTTLRATMQISHRSDFCVGYLNLRDWQAIDELVAPWNLNIGQVCRVLVGMQRPPYEEIRELSLEPIVQRAARLICTTAEFDDLAKSLELFERAGLSGTALYGTIDPTERAKLRAELDGLIAHLYGLTEAEFAHIVGTFPLVPQPVKVAAQNAYRDVERGVIK